MKTNQSSKMNKSRKWFLVVLMMLTGFGITTFTVLGLTNEFNELFNYSLKEWMEVGVGFIALGALIFFFRKLMNKNISKKITTN